MKNRMNIDNPFFNLMGKWADIALLNLFFMVFSLPVVTAGAATAAMYGTLRAMPEENFISVFKTFTAIFKKIFRESLGVWMVQLVTGLLLFFDLGYTTMKGQASAWHGAAMVIGGLLLLWMMIACYLFPAGKYHMRPLGAAITESLYLAVRNLPYTIAMVLLNAIPFICLLLGDFAVGLVLPIYLFIGFGVTAWINSQLLNKCRDLNRCQCD